MNMEYDVVDISPEEQIKIFQEKLDKANNDLYIFDKEDILKYLEHYNLKRMHMGIKFKTPQEMLN